MPPATPPAWGMTEDTVGRWLRLMVTPTGLLWLGGWESSKATISRLTVMIGSKLGLMITSKAQSTRSERSPDGQSPVTGARCAEGGSV